jgi:hypothetical protein
MKLAEPDWQVISSLLDEALELPADSRTRWLDAIASRRSPSTSYLSTCAASRRTPELPGPSRRWFHANPLRRIRA